MIFYLQTGFPDNREGWRESRTFLDSRIHPGCDVSLTVVANDWKEARHKLDTGDIEK